MGLHVSPFYSKEGDKSGVQYDAEWKTYKYFLSSQETGIELSMLQMFDVELLIGQVSYKQKADIYNVYDTTIKKRTKQVSESAQVSEDTEPVLEVCRYRVMCKYPLSTLLPAIIYVYTCIDAALLPRGRRLTDVKLRQLT